MITLLTLPYFLFQSTPPSREATPQSGQQSGASGQFQSTPPSREATRGVAAQCFCGFISIHASLAGGDGTRFIGDGSRSRFQSTPPSWEATA